MGDAGQVSTTEQPVWFPAAAQADIVRAVQKDKLCADVLESSLLEVVQNLMGPAFLMQHRDGLKALARALYYGSSTGVGQQTLGEEYCDILQVTGSKLAPSTAQRAAQVLLHTVLPLLQARLANAAPADDEPEAARPQHAEAEQQASLRTPALQSPLSAGGNGADTHGRAASPETPAGNGTDDLLTDMLCSPRFGASPRQSLDNEPHHAASNTSNLAATALPCTQLSHVMHTVQRAARRTQQQLRSIRAALWQRRIAVLCGLASWLPVLSQLHLAFFYLRGVFFEVPKRLTGVRMLFVGPMNASRRYYGVMGALLLLQIAARALHKARCAHFQISGPAFALKQSLMKKNKMSVNASRQSNGAVEQPC
jgi:peroxin-10